MALGACMARGVHGWGACMVKGGMHGWGACVVKGGMHGEGANLW